MKQIIEVGANVDDGSGDYLRKGGQKINNNFNEIYNKLGDDESIHESGAWKTVSNSTAIDFGRSLAVNTTLDQVNITLPKGTPDDYNKTIRLRDVWNSWSKNPVTVYSAVGDTIKGENKQVFNIDLMDIELVYCNPGRWEYIGNKRVDAITNSNLSTVASKSFIAVDGQKTFSDVFDGNTYNPKAVEVYYRGNLLYYGDSFDEFSEYGSLDVGSVLGELDGKNITLAFECDAGDTVTVVTYMDGIAAYRTSYISKTVVIRDQNIADPFNQTDSVLIIDLSKKTFDISEFNFSIHEKINPLACEIYVNGILLTDESSAYMQRGVCSIDGINNEEECISNNGEWEIVGVDYELILENNSVKSIIFAKPFNDHDVITIKCFNNDIGTILEWDGDNGIRERVEGLFIQSGDEVQREIIEYTDYNNPSQKTMRKIVDPIIGKINNTEDLFSVLYPIGTIYENAHNPDNPAKYMGFGLWKRFQEGRVTVSWNSDSSDAIFGLNNNDIVSGVPTHTSGGTGGERSVSLTRDNIPNLESTKQVLIRDSAGSVVIGACEFDPDEQGPDIKNYAERTITVNESVNEPVDISIIQPYVTVHRWIRVG